MRMKPIAVALLSLGLLAGGSAALSAHAQDTTLSLNMAPDKAPPPTPVALDELDAFIANTQKKFDVPGIAIAIVKDGQIVYERGFGIREMGKPDKVTPDTMFAIASNTKAFTASALAKLADEGKLSYDDRVIDHLPWFRMNDPYVTHEMRIKDLLSHRSGLGLGAGDLLYWPGTTYSTEEVARRLKDVPLVGSFRGQYAYDNILFGVAGLVVEKVSGMSFRDYLIRNFFTPLGMSNTVYNSDDLKPSMNTAVGHAKSDFTKLEPVKVMSWHNVSGAGGIYSSVHDISKWMIANMQGKIVSPKMQKQMWSIITPMNIAEPPVPELAGMKPNFQGYGAGWQLSDYRGTKLVWHTGGWPGQVSRVTLVPDKKIGIVVLTNAEVGAAFQAVTYRALDAMLGNPSHDWNNAYGLALAKQQSNADDSWKKHLASRNASLKPSLPLASYAQTYRDPWYGDVRVFMEGSKLRMQFAKTPDLLGTLEPWQGNTFIAKWDQRWLNGDAFVNFNLDADGAIVGATMSAVSPLTDFSFDYQDLRLSPVKEKK